MRPLVAALAMLFAFAPPVNAQTADKPLTTAVNEEEGEFLVAGNGYSLYLFKADRQGTAGQQAASVCEGDCLATWPALLVEGEVAVSGNVRSELIGTIVRSDGKTQVTYNGWPLYFYAEDIQPGDIIGHDLESFGEDWYLVGPSGERARKDDDKDDGDDKDDDDKDDAN